VAPVPTEPSRSSDDEFTGLYRQYHPQLLRYVTCHFGPRDADEIAQEALTRALRSLDRRRTEAETWAWLVRVARNIACDLARARRLCEATDDDTVLHDEVPADAALPEPALLLDERRSLVRRALKSLPATQRRILVLYEVDELNCPTIAQLVGSTEYAVRKALQRARRTFANEVRALGGGAVAVVWGVRGVFRRRPRGLSAAAAGTAVCAFAGTVVFSVGVTPAPEAAAPRLDRGVTASASTRDARDAVPVRAATTRAVRRAAAGGSAGGAFRQPRVTAPRPDALVRVPRTPVSPGSRTRIHRELQTPVGTTIVVDETISASDNGHGVVCTLPSVQCD
jgi:RNA polymerase sigma-70 factor (ECF subfamily)